MLPRLEFGKLWLQGLSNWLRKAGVKARDLKALCLCLAATALCTWLAFHEGLNLASSGFLYLVFVVLAAVYGGFWQATATSIFAVACLDLFFVPPQFTFTVSDPRNWAALGAFEFTALVVSQLSHHAQIKASEAIAERRDTERLYQISRQVLLLDRSREPGPWIPSLVCEAFGLGGAVLFDAISATTHASGTLPTGAEERTREAYYSNADRFDADMAAWFCVLRLGARPVGGLGLCGCKMSPLVATALASLSAIAIERKRSFEREFHAEAAREAEQLRTAVLDALAHEFKTPLATILTASSGLLAAGSLSPSQAELAALIEEEAGEMNGLASNLLRAAKLDGVDFKPKREPILLSSLIDPAIKILQTEFAAGRFRVIVSRDEAVVMIDRKLIITALAQILENAIKYSVPESPIDVEVKLKDAEVIVSVQNQGQGIAPTDRERIFERFYRGRGTEQRPPGTGLGLSIVKRIVEAHHGRVWVEGNQDRGTTFSLALPALLKK
ncbi:MAG TPA: ATP-binding protein [Terriglobia bacterium]|nr:ATP-binding protein [Terriglobia bacterium]